MLGANDHAWDWIATKLNLSTQIVNDEKVVNLDDCDQLMGINSRVIRIHGKGRIIEATEEDPQESITEDEQVLELKSTPTLKPQAPQLKQTPVRKRGRPTVTSMPSSPKKQKTEKKEVYAKTLDDILRGLKPEPETFSSDEEDPDCCKFKTYKILSIKLILF